MKIEGRDVLIGVTIFLAIISLIWAGLSLYAVATIAYYTQGLMLFISLGLLSLIPVSVFILCKTIDFCHYLWYDNPSIIIFDKEKTIPKAKVIKK